MTKIINDTLKIYRFKSNSDIISFTIFNITNKPIKDLKIKLRYKNIIIDSVIYPNNSYFVKVESKTVMSIDDIIIDDYSTLDEVNVKHHHVKDMTSGNIKNLIITFAFPIFLSQLFQTLYNTVDSLIVGNFIGKEALAAVASSSSLIFLLTSFFLGTSLGAGVLIAKFFGAKNYYVMSKAIHTNIVLSLIISTLLTIVGVIFTPFILKLMKTSSDVLPLSIEYLRYYFLGVVAIVMFNVFNGTLQAVGNSTRPLINLIISSILNVLLDLLFIGVFKFGVASAAIATTISQFFSAFLCFIHLIKKNNIYKISVLCLKVDKEMLKGIIKYGMPTGIMNSVIGLANVFVQANINVFGSDAMAGCGTYNKLEGFAFIPILAFNNAISTFISQNLGAKEFDRAKKGAIFGITSSMLMAEVIGILFFLLAPFLIKLFSDDKDAISYGVLEGRTISLFYFLLALSHAIAAVCRGSGRAIVPMFVMLSCWCIIRLIYIYIAMYYTNDIQFIFFAYPITWTLSSIIYVIYLFKSDWIHSFERKKDSLSI